MKRFFLLLLLLACLPQLAAASGFTVVKKGYTRSIETYQMPDLLLTNEQGHDIALPELLDTDKPVVVSFIYATCTTICPLLSLGYVDLQREMGEDREKVLLISVTIDPEYDTPEILADYRKKYGGKSGWTLLTGSRLDIDQVMNAFDSFFGDKMDHEPLNFIRTKNKDQWVRLDGMLNGKDLIYEMQQVGVLN